MRERERERAKVEEGEKKRASNYSYVCLKLQPPSVATGSRRLIPKAGGPRGFAFRITRATRQRPITGHTSSGCILILTLRPWGPQHWKYPTVGFCWFLSASVGFCRFLLVSAGFCRFPFFFGGGRYDLFPYDLFPQLDLVRKGALKER